eukprot:TRINITY_DN345_c0_g2_i1.p1 TRINITY_DN345_c0_g2~~TRINITY_DN345_c0_g2_i1.p1  ORF type:complete len:595 (-),score=107.19 TRINITY_DN345_c0_g2_i1:88-1872(-)
MMPWNGRSDNLIDRFDGRSYLDIIPESSKTVVPLTEEELELENSLNFERYYYLLQNFRHKVPEKQAINDVGTRILESLKPPAPFVAKSHKGSQTKGGGSGQYTTVGYHYDGSDGEEDSPEEDNGNSKIASPGSDVSPEHQAPDHGQGPSQDDSSESELPSSSSTPAPDEPLLDATAIEFGIKSYCRLLRADNLLHHSEKLRQMEVSLKRSGPRLSRKERRRERDRQREKRERALNKLYRNEKRRNSPSHESRKRRKTTQATPPRRGGKVPRSETPEKESLPKIEYISEIQIDASAQTEPASAAPEEVVERRQTLGLIHEASPEPQTHLVPTPPYRSQHSNQIDHAYIQNGSRAKGRRSKGASRTGDVKKSSSSSQINSQSQSQTGISSRSSTAIEEEKSLVKETPAERLKRRLRQQLNKKIQKDQEAAEKKKDEQEHEKIRRRQQLRNRRRSRSRSSSRSRSRSRSLSPAYSYSSSADSSRYSSSSSRSRSRTRTPRRSRVAETRQPSSRRSYSRTPSRSRSPRNSRSDRETRRRGSSSSRSRSRSRSRSYSRSGSGSGSGSEYSSSPDPRRSRRRRSLSSSPDRSRRRSSRPR